MRLMALGVVGLLGCGVGASSVNEAFDDDFEAVADAELANVKGTGSGLTVTAKAVLEPRQVGSETRWVLSATTNKDLSEVFSFVPDDAFGQATVVGPRAFEVSVDSRSELNTVLSGLKLLVNVTPVGSTRPVTVGLDLEPRFVGISGSTRIVVRPEVSPVFARGGLTYRGFARTASSVLSSVSNQAQFAERAVQGEYDVDFSFDALVSALDAPATNAKRVQFKATAPTGTLRTKTATLSAAVRKIALTTGDPYEVWPAASCTPEVKACLEATPIGTTDFGACGTYRQVSRCGLPHQVPALFASPDDLTALTQALAAIIPPSGKSVSFSAYGLFDNRNVTVDLAARGWMQQANVAGTLGAVLTPGQVNTLLDGWNARSLVPATQQTVLQQSFKAIRVDSAQGTHIVLLFTSASRVTVFTLR